MADVMTNSVKRMIRIVIYMQAVMKEAREEFRLFFSQWGQPQYELRLPGLIFFKGGRNSFNTWSNMPFKEKNASFLGFGFPVACCITLFRALLTSRMSGCA